MEVYIYNTHAIYNTHVRIYNTHVHIYNIHVHITNIRMRVYDTHIGYILLMVLPPKVVDYKVLVRAMLDNIRAQGVAFDPASEGRKYVRPPVEGDEEGDPEIHRFFPWVKVEVEDHAVSPPVKRFIYVTINHIVGDTRGWTANTGHKAAPCIHGMCPICDQLGVHDKKASKTYYPGARRHLTGQRYQTPT